MGAFHITAFNDNTLANFRKNMSSSLLNYQFRILIVCYTNLLSLIIYCLFSITICTTLCGDNNCMSCDIFVLNFLSTKYQVNIIHFRVSLLILDWKLSTLYFDGSFVDQYIKFQIEPCDKEQMIFFLFDPHILLFVIFCLFKYHLYMYLQISRLSRVQTHVLMCLCLCHMTLPVVRSL